MNVGLLMSRRDASIIRLFIRGVPCSQIDEVMRLIDGTAHDVVVKWWRKDKEAARERR